VELAAWSGSASDGGWEIAAEVLYRALRSADGAIYGWPRHAPSSLARGSQQTAVCRW